MREGHDACRFVQTDDGWSIGGTTVFDHGGNAAHLAYDVASGPSPNIPTCG
ncbi:hypothetical protein [Paracoccus alcaliphilus]|uniref:hypothetical protein n=1 Tax=Paracoccus alcaliphilus TaxID=34002 RepID=UPI00147A84D3|nr:hypothetical protein [Paracoccus alcaliphilus]